MKLMFYNSNYFTSLKKNCFKYKNINMHVWMDQPEFIKLINHTIKTILT